MESSRQNLTIEEQGVEKKKKGFFLTTTNLLLFLAVFVAACITVALIVHFAVPRTVCPYPTTVELVESCKVYMEEVGRDKVCPKKPVVEEKIDEKKTKEEEAAAAAALRTGLRLNRTLLPYHYDLLLWPRFYEGDDFSFTGDVTIHFTCKEDTNVIVLHVDMVTVDDGQIMLKDSNMVEQQINTTEEDVPRHFYKIYPVNKLQKDQNYTVKLSFNGTLIHDDWMGFYRSSYIENNQKNWIVSTQFELTAARRAFPLFDESSFKSTFKVTMVRKDGYFTLSNTEKEATRRRGDGWYEDTFEKTVVMPPYLLAYAISKFSYVEKFTNRGTRTRVYARPSYIKYAEYANNITATILQAFEEWTGIPYALTKLDQFAVPNFAFGAMENWGLVIYRETALLYNPEYTKIDEKRYTAYVIAHELAHQWFGNLVTCYWWDDTFLNEAFATYFGYHVGLKAAEPTWNVDEFFIRVMQQIMEQDGSHRSQPIRVPNLEHHDDLLKAFSRITYSKGGSILRMTRDFLGKDTFQKGLQKYLRDNAYKPVEDDDLYKALQEQAVADGSVTWDAQKTNISGILSSWVDQQNFPLLEVTDLADGSLKVTQSHFVYDKEQNVSHPTPLGSEFIWDIPLTWSDTAGETNFTWMHREKEIRLQGNQRHGWKYLNPKLTGFYRTKYGPENWNAILYQLMQNHTVFPVENRAGFIDDAFQIARAGEMEEVDALRSTEYLRYEREYLPWYPGVRGRTNYYLDMFYGKPVYDHLERYLMNLVLPTYNISGWTVPNDPGVLLDRYTRTIVISTACAMNYKPCVDQAQNLYDQFMNQPDNNPIAPDLRPLVYCTGVARGGVQEWEFLKGRLQHNYGDVYIAYENRTVERALACPISTNIIRKYLDFSLAYNSTGMFTAIAYKREARDTVWNYIIEHWDDFGDGNETRIRRGSVLVAVTSTWNTDAELRKFEDFIATHNETELARTYSQILETIRDNKDWLDVNMTPIENWLKAVNSRQSYTRMTSGRRRRRSTGQHFHQDFDTFHDMHQVAVGA